MTFIDSEGNAHSFGKSFDYPMFSKGFPWRGSTNGADSKGFRVIRSKADTGPIKWEESNIDFRHKGHKGIFRPRYNGDLQASPTEYFEYWEPAKWFGWNRKNFTKVNNSVNNSVNYGLENFKHIIDSEKDPDLKSKLI
jgi:hypothetical protein